MEFASLTPTYANLVPPPLPGGFENADDSLGELLLEGAGRQGGEMESSLVTVLPIGLAGFEKADDSVVMGTVKRRRSSGEAKSLARAETDGEKTRPHQVKESWSSSRRTERGE